MIVNLVTALEEWLLARGLFRFVRVFTFVEFRAILAVVTSFLCVMVASRPMIRWLLKHKVGDAPEFHHADLNRLMERKTDTPTMGGVLIAFSIGGTSLLLADIASFYVQMALICLVFLAGVGMVDDWLKLTQHRRGPGSRDGLRSWEKLLFQLGLALLLGRFIHHHGATKFAGDLEVLSQLAHSLTLPLFRSWVFDPELGEYVPDPNLIVLGPWLFVTLATLVIAGFSNAVNLADGMDGLVSGLMAIVAFAFMLLALAAGWGDGSIARQLLIPYVPLSDELAVVAGSMLGASLGFLWFNCAPASVFMGDTGALTLGGLIGYIAVVIRQEFLLLVIGGLFVAELASVALQVGWYRVTGGRRLFRCAPLHHHFQLAGWTEQQVVVRFWLITALLAALALATLRLR